MIYISVFVAVSYIKTGLAIHFIYDIIHASMPFPQIISSLPSPTESKRLFYTSVSLLLSHKWLTSFPRAPLVKEIVFNPLYILASFVKDKVSIGAWIYLWASYFVPLIYIFVFVPVPYCLDDRGFVVEPEVRQVDSSSSILLCQDCFVCSRFFVFPYKL